MGPRLGTNGFIASALPGGFETPWWLGHLRFSPAFRYGNSAAFTLGIGIDRNLNDVSTDRLRFSGNIKDIIWREPGSPLPSDALLAQFSLQPIGARGGNLQRNSGTGPSLYLFDLNVTREWKFGERFKLRPTIEFGNILNTVVFNYGSEFIDFSAPPGPTATAAQITAYANFKRDFLVPTRTFRPRDIREACGSTSSDCGQAVRGLRPIRRR